MITHGAPHEPRRVIVVDSYDHKRRQQALEMSGTLRIVVDDLVEAVPVGFDVIWNPNAYANSSMYPTFPGHVVSGPDAVPLRGELPVWHLPATRSIGVSLGGGVLPAVLRAAVEELPSRYPGWRFCAVGSWEHPALRDIPADEPWRELVACDRLLISAGTTAWEAAAVGSPVALVQTAPNQARILDWARRAGVPGVTVAEAVGEKNLAARLGEALMSAARLPGIRNGASLVARTFARFAGHRMASL